MTYQPLYRRLLIPKKQEQVSYVNISVKFLANKSGLC